MTPEAAPAGTLEPPPRAKPWALRLFHTISQVATFVLIWWFATLGQLHAATFREMEIRVLPVLTEIVTRMSDVILQPGVLIVGAAAALALIVVGHFGLIDRALAPLIVADLVIIAFLLVGWWVGLRLPLRQIQEKLSG